MRMSSWERPNSSILWGTFPNWTHCFKAIVPFQIVQVVSSPFLDEFLPKWNGHTEPFSKKQWAPSICLKTRGKQLFWALSSKWVQRPLKKACIVVVACSTAIISHLSAGSAAHYCPFYPTWKWIVWGHLQCREFLVSRTQTLQNGAATFGAHYHHCLISVKKRATAVVPSKKAWLNMWLSVLYIRKEIILSSISILISSRGKSTITEIDIFYYLFKYLSDFSSQWKCS